MMPRRTAALWTLLIALPFGALTANDFRSGVSRVYPLHAFIPLRFERRAQPGLFWASTIFNTLLFGFFTLAAVLMLIIP
jgi:hypothetical protein